MNYYYFIKCIIKSSLLIFIFRIIIFEDASNINLEDQLCDYIKKNKKSIINKEQPSLNPIKEYVNLIQEKKINYVHYKDEINNPKISFIATFFNKEKYLEPIILSIQNQMLKEFEIIFIDDCSNDNGVKLINEYIEIDKRIKLIKNKINKGALYSRSQGAIHSKGEYIIFIDSDDLVLKSGIYNSYNYIKKNDLSMIQFNSIFKINETLKLSKRYYKYENIIKQPILSYVFFYNENVKKGAELNTALWDKLIKREIVEKAINFIGSEYYEQNLRIENDVILLFSLFKMANSYQYINETGYFYISDHNDSITNSWRSSRFDSIITHGLFTNIKFLYDKSGNSYLDKLFCVYKLQQTFKRYIICFSNAKKEYIFIKHILNKLLFSPYISKEDKIIISLIERSIYNLFGFNLNI